MNRFKTTKSSMKTPQRGITLIIAMITLLIISALAAVTIKGSGSSELVANNSRSQQMAWQVAEAALRYCEFGVRNTMLINNSKTIPTSDPQYTLTIAAEPAGSTPAWATSTSWDSTSTNRIMVPLATLDNPNYSTDQLSGSDKRLQAKFEGIYQRPPDCIAQYQGATGTPGANIVTVVARGFGPEVRAGTSSPQGSEVFLQSILDFN